MPKRFRRFFPAEFGTALPALVGATVHVTLRDDRVLHGKLLGVGAGTLDVEDGKQHRHKVPWSEVVMVLSDYVAAF